MDCLLFNPFIHDCSPYLQVVLLLFPSLINLTCATNNDACFDNKHVDLFGFWSSDTLRYIAMDHLHRAHRQTLRAIAFFSSVLICHPLLILLRHNGTPTQQDCIILLIVKYTFTIYYACCVYFQYLAFLKIICDSSL